MPRKSQYDHLRADAIRMRDADRMGIKAICRALDVPISTLHYWLKDHPLTKAEQAAIVRDAPRYVAPKKDLHEGTGFPCKVAERLSTIELGAIGESAILYRLCLMGFRSSVAFADGDVVDLYVRGRHGGQRVAFVQVRMASRSGPNGLPKISLRRNSNGKTSLFKPGDMHFLVGFCMENQNAYVYAYDEVAHLRNCIAVTADAREAWQKLKVWLEADETLEAPRPVASADVPEMMRPKRLSGRSKRTNAPIRSGSQTGTTRYRAARGR